MEESGNRPSSRILQKRLTLVLAILGLLGSLLLGLLWWDSTTYFTALSIGDHHIVCWGSSLRHYSGSMILFIPDNSNFFRVPLAQYGLTGSPVFPIYRINSALNRIPIYLILLAYLATLLLIWLVLMSRLARRHFEKTRALPTQD
jgi:hypothetical protein